MLPIAIDKPTPAQLVVFSDVDGVFRHAESSVVLSAARVCTRLQREGVNIVLCSHKTRAEIEQTQRVLGLHQPFIAEGGAAVFVPKGYFTTAPAGRDIAGYSMREFGAPYAAIVHALRAAAERLHLHVVGCNDMTIEEIARDWRLPLLGARLAKLREYIEPFRVNDGSPRALVRLSKTLEGMGVYCRQRAGMCYATGVNKPSAATSWLLQLFQAAGGRVMTIGLTSARDESPLFGPMMREAVVMDDDRWQRAVDIHAWAAGILDLVDEVRAHVRREALAR